jgi:biopolymer transport protein ExbB
MIAPLISTIADPGSGPSVWDFVVRGGLMMIPIGLCSLIALAVVIERFVSLRRGNVIPGDFFAGLKRVLEKHPEDRQKALDYCKSNPSPVANVFAAGIKRLGGPIELVEKHITEAGEREMLKLRKFSRALSVIAAVTPLMGLLGTILGMIKAFQTVAVSAEALGRTELLAEGIYEAMITTAAGLVVAIPVLVAYHWITGRIEKLVMEIDQLTVEFVEDHALPATEPARTARAGVTMPPAAAGELDGATPDIGVSPS